MPISIQNRHILDVSFKYYKNAVQLFLLAHGPSRVAVKTHLKHIWEFLSLFDITKHEALLCNVILVLFFSDAVLCFQICTAKPVRKRE